MTARGPSLRRDLGLLPLIAVLFFNVSGGPYGIEDAVASFGPGLALLLLILTPFVWSLPVAVLAIVGAGRVQTVPWQPFAPTSGGSVEALGLGLAVMMWNYSGWDNPSTCLGETRAPETTCRRALWWSPPLGSLVHVIPVGIGLGAVGGWERLSSPSRGSCPACSLRVILATGPRGSPSS